MNSYVFLSFKNELYRKLIHVLSSAIPIFYLFNDKAITVVFTFIILICMLLIEIFRKKSVFVASLFKQLLGSFVRDYEKNDFMSGTYLMVASFLTVALFDKYTAILSLLILSICDSAAAITGMRFGNIKIFNNKTIEGTLAFILTGFIIIILYDQLIISNFNYFYSIIMIFIVSIIEHITPTKFDNITIPLSSAIIISFLNIL